MSKEITIDFQHAGEFEDAGKWRVVSNVRLREEWFAVLGTHAPRSLRGRKIAAPTKEPRLASRRLWCIESFESLWNSHKGWFLQPKHCTALRY